MDCGHGLWLQMCNALCARLQMVEMGVEQSKQYIGPGRACCSIVVSHDTAPDTHTRTHTHTHTHTHMHPRTQERPDLANLKSQLTVSNAKMKKELQDIEDKILHMLSNSKVRA